MFGQHAAAGLTDVAGVVSARGPECWRENPGLAIRTSISPFARTLISGAGTGAGLVVVTSGALSFDIAEMAAAAAMAAAAPIASDSAVPSPFGSLPF